MSKRIKFVKQRLENDCVIAALATILNKKYEEVSSKFNLVSVDKDGIEVKFYEDYLIQLGCEIITKQARETIINSEAWLEMFKPFADIHILLAKKYVNHSFGHAYIMTKDGTIYNNDGTKRHVDDLYDVYNVTGIYYNKRSR